MKAIKGPVRALGLKVGSRNYKTLVRTDTGALVEKTKA
jgi:hypothetical protein